MSEDSALPPQHQEQQPGIQSRMSPPPISIDPHYIPSAKLVDKVALISGGDSGIGRAVSLIFAKEGANLAIIHTPAEREDALRTAQLVEGYGRTCLLIAGDVGEEAFCKEAVDTIIDELGRLDVLVNNAGEQHQQMSVADITQEQLLRTFKTNIFAMFYLVKAALPHLKDGARIINTASVTAYHGSPHLLDYSATKGAIVSFTRSLSQQLIGKGIHVNAVAPGPVWTPLIPASFSDEEVAHFGKNVPIERPGQPFEIAHAFLFLASEGATYMSGQVLHPNGGSIVNT